MIAPWTQQEEKEEEEEENEAELLIDTYETRLSSLVPNSTSFQTKRFPNCLPNFTALTYISTKPYIIIGI